MRLCSLFAGIGGFDLAALWMSWATAVLVEWEAFPRAVLIKNFHCVPAEDLSPAQLAAIIDAWRVWTPGQPHPTTVLYGDIRHFDATPWRGAIDLVCGGFPCQPYSDAGKKLGNDDPRALFPQMLRIIRELAPRLVVGENVRGLLSQAKGLAFESVCTGLEAEGYEVQPLLLPACGVGAPHKRDRFWFVAHADGHRCGAGLPRRPKTRYQAENGAATHSNGQGWADGVHGTEAGSQRATNKPAHTNCRHASAHAHGVGQPQPQGPQPELGRRAEHGREEAATDSHGGGCRAHECELREWQCDFAGCSTRDTQSQPSHGSTDIHFGSGTQQGSVGGNRSIGPLTDWRLTEPPLCGPDDGIPAGLVRTESRDHRAGKKGGSRQTKEDQGRAFQLKGYGNAIVPQVAYQIFQALEAATP